MIDLNLLKQVEATQHQYIFNFVLMNVIFLLGFLFRKNRQTFFFTWLLILIFCLFAYWDTDYFTFRGIFYTSLADFRDPFYYYWGLISFNSYTVFRFYIWGLALLLLFKTSQHLKINRNTLAFVFPIFFLLLFSYARASLGMAMYFYGLSFLLVPKKNKTIISYIWGILFICFSYFGHRSMLLPIALTPLIFFKFNKYVISALLVIGFIIGRSAETLLSMASLEGLPIESSVFKAASEGFEAYAAKDTVVEYNWKYTLTQNLKNIGLSISFVYLIWKCYIPQNKINIANWCLRLLNVCTGIFVIAISILLVDGLGAGIIGYRFLYMLGIPFSLIIAYLYSKEFCKPFTLFLVLLSMILFNEGFVFGKILSF